MEPDMQTKFSARCDPNDEEQCQVNNIDTGGVSQLHNAIHMSSG